MVICEILGLSMVFWRFGDKSCGVGWFWWDRHGNVVICEILGLEKIGRFWANG